MATYYWVGGTGTWSGTGNTQFAITSGGAATALNPTNADTVNFDANSGTAATVTVTSTAVSLSTIVNKADINLSLSGNCTLCTTAGTLTLTAGTLTLNTHTLSTGFFSSTNTNTRSIAFGTGQINLTGNAGNIWNAANVTNFTFTGTSKVNCTYSGSTSFRSWQHATTGDTGTNSVNVNVTAGSDQFIHINGSTFLNLDFTGFTGAWTSTTSICKIYGNLKLVAGMTFPASGTISFATQAGNTSQITSAAITFPCSITQNTASATVQLQDNLTIGATRTYTLTAGTLDLSSGNRILNTGLFVSTNTNTRVIAFGTGNITTTGSGTVWNTSSTTGFSYTGTPTVNISNNSATATTVSTGSMTQAQSLNFNYTVGTYTLTDTTAVYKSLNFTGFTGTIPNSVRTIYGNLTISSGMALTAGANATTFAATSGTNNITTAAKTLDFPITIFGLGGTFAFQDALTQGATRAFTFTAGTVQFKASATSTTGVFATSGSNQKFLQSTTPGTQATLSQASGTVDVSRLTIQDNAAVGGATFKAYVDQENIDAGNNDGWDFGISPIVGGNEYTYQLRSFTQPRRF